MTEGSTNINILNQSEYDEKVNNNKYVCNELNSHKQPQQHLKGETHLSKTKSQEMIEQDTSNTSTLNLNKMQDNLTEVYPDGLTCTICKINFTSLSHKDSHYQGKRHATALKALKLKEKDIPLRCDICCNQFSSEISARDHFASEKHKKRATLGDNIDPSIKEAINNTKWIQCEVCNVPLNSPQQYSIHCKSEKHKKKEATILILNRRVASPSLMESASRMKENSLAVENKTNEGAFSSYSNSTTTTPKAEKGSILPKSLLPNIIATEALEREIYNRRDYEIFDNSENSYGYSSGDSRSNIRDLRTISIDSSGKDELKEISKNYNADSYSSRESGGLRSHTESSLDETFETNLMTDFTTDSAMKKVPNSMQLNNNFPDTVALSQNSLIKPNNFSLSEEASSTYNDSENSDLTTQENITDEEISNIVTSVKKMHISTENKSPTTTSNIDNSSKKAQESSSAGGNGRGSSSGTNKSKTGNSISPENNKDEIPYLHRAWIEPVEVNGRFICYYCKLCDSQLNQGAVIIHIEGLNHRQKMMTQAVPERDLPPVEYTCEDATDEAYGLTKFIPRSYQVELFEKCYLRDSIIFLPTGTGKTLCASMLISYMLDKNPKRSVLFLVDKVLLVFQQKNFIEGQLNKKFLRFDFEDNDKLVERKLNIACVCGGTVGTQDKPLWMHDIVISTAAFCSNMIAQNVIRWSDFSFVVVDEAHHCVKNHPFKKIFSKYHGTLEKDQRPKILGLTASPAGQETLEGTVEMLVRLSLNMGSAKISIVEDAVSELKKYKSNAKLVIEMLPPSNEEMSFNFMLQKYLMQCLFHLKKKSNISDYIDYITDKDKIELNAEKLDELQNALNIILIDKGDRAVGTSLLWHVRKITTALTVSLEMGIPLALEELKSLLDGNDKIDNFSKALELGLPCQQIKELCEKYLHIMDDALWEENEIMSTVHFLIHKIAKHINAEDEKNAIVLVLVKQRATAVQLSKIMQKSNTMKQHNLSTVSLVGHGAGTSIGMNVNDQKKVLKEINDNMHQVIIATSVAEEGIDLPECSLVITMKPPTSITTLVQMRGRARKKNSLFLTVCSNEKEKSKIENLLKQEEVMEKATSKLVKFYKNK